MFITDSDLKTIKNAPEDTYLGLFQKKTLTLAESRGLDEKELSFTKGKATFLETARKFSNRIMYASYGYRVTRDKDYLRHAEDDINRYCDNFGEWNTGYFLENAESAVALSLAYDWLYKSLKASTKDKIIDWLEEYCYEACLNDTKQVWFYRSNNNWNHVCNAGMVVSALATYERHPEIARQLISKSILSNPKGMEGVYAPDGAGYEGPGYWNFATAYEGMLLMALGDAFGTDFGLGELPGFSKSGLFKVFSISNCNQQFNYADGSSKAGQSLPLWYLAYRFGDPGLLFREVEYLKDEKRSYGDRGFFIALASAKRMGEFEVKPVEGRLYSAKGLAPIVIARSGWERGDCYLGIKGGTPHSNHGHMDVGSFVYESDGVRWTCDMGAGPGGYERYRQAIRKEGGKGDLFNLSQDSPRWRFFHHNNRQHNTLTINDRDQQVDGFADFTTTYEEPSRLGGRFDLSSVYSAEAGSVVRTLLIKDDSYLEVTDEIEARGDKPAHVRWTLVTGAKVKVDPDGITLTSKGKSVTLSSTGADVVYGQFNSNAQLSGEPFAKYESDQSGKFTVCGFEFDIPAGEKRTVVTTLRRP